MGKFFFSLLILPLAVMGQPVKKDYKAELRKLTGSWTGTLQYTDYSDDKKQVILKTKLEVTDAGDSLKMKVTYFESATDSIISTFGMHINADGTLMRYDGEVYQVGFIQFKKTATTFLTTPDTEEKLKDNNKNADIEKIFTVSKGRFTIVKKVKYEGAKNYFVRNTYTFTR